jgi:hypothetical protein
MVHADTSLDVQGLNFVIEQKLKTSLSNKICISQFFKSDYEIRMTTF